MRRFAGLAILAAAGVVAPAVGGPPGNVNGQNEQVQITAIEQVRALEQQALALAQAQDQNAPLPAETAMAVKAKIEAALAGIAALKTAVEAGGPYQESTVEAEAIKNLEKATMSDVLARTKIEKNKAANMVVHDLARAETFKGRSQLFLMGIRTTPKDDAAIAANNVSSQTVPRDADLTGNKKDATLSKDDVEKGRGDALRGRGRARKEKKPRWYPGLSVAAVSNPPDNFYYGFEGTSSDPGYTFKSFDRQLFGPFETRFEVGAFDPDMTGDTGSACIEFDVVGSSPLQFVAVCGRRVEGGVQVFVQSHLGAQGNLYFSDTMIATVLVEYDGTNFVVKAGPGRGAPDFTLSSVGTAVMAQGEDALVLGMGASGLTSGAEIGLDEIFITAE